MLLKANFHLNTRLYVSFKFFSALSIYLEFNFIIKSIVILRLNTLLENAYTCSSKKQGSVSASLL